MLSQHKGMYPLSTNTQIRRNLTSETQAILVGTYTNNPFPFQIAAEYLYPEFHWITDDQNDFITMTMFCNGLGIGFEDRFVDFPQS